MVMDMPEVPTNNLQGVNLILENYEDYSFNQEESYHLETSAKVFCCIFLRIKNLRAINCTLRHVIAANKMIASYLLKRKIAR